MKSFFKNHLTQLAVGFALLGTHSLKAVPFNFHVDLTTSALTGAPFSPFFLDFQLNEGSSSLLNSVTLSHFVFTAGSAVGTPVDFGGVAGSLSSSITLSDSPASPFNEIFQGFSAGTTAIHFDVSVSQNIAGITPDLFAAAILDSEPGNLEIATTAPDGISLVVLDIGAANTLGNVGVYSSTSPVGVRASDAAITPVPEPSSLAAFGSLMLAAIVTGRRFGKRRAASTVTSA